ncbi:ankyrin repeat-containing domain protein [Aspergillus granulosus]|uniref:Ankyrin repeat-containing domain protein n=1 Tax=Aspergillus granulosus TaxID=176169 RepID=A0ABR4H2M0_9EURO
MHHIGIPPRLQPSFLGLPSEIIYEIADCLEIRDLNAVVQTARRFDALLSPDLYRAGARYLSVNYTTPLIWAVRHHRLVAAQKLLERGADPVANFLGTTALHEAIKSNDTDAVLLILDQRIFLHPHDVDGMTPLVLAASCGRPSIVRLLLAAGADVGGANLIDWQTAIHRSVSEQNESGCRLLLETAAEVLDSNMAALQRYIRIQLLPDIANTGHTAMLKIPWDFYAAEKSEREATASDLLLSAAYGGRVETAQWLVSIGAKLTRPNPNDKTALHIAAENSDSELVGALLHMGADIEARDYFQHTPLFAAIYWGSLDAVRLLLDRGANPFAILPRGQNALHLCASRNKPALIPDLCRAGVNIHATDDDGDTALHYAAEGGYFECVQLLLRANADINARGRLGYTPLHTAIIVGGTEVSQLLMESGADLSAVDSKGYTLLHTAAQYGFNGFFSILLEATQKLGLPLSSPSVYGMTALEDAVCGHHGEIVETLLGAGVDANVSRNGTYALHLAVTRGLQGIDESLLSHGADPFLLDERGRTALDWARLNESIWETMAAHCGADGASRVTDPTQQALTLRKSIVDLATYLRNSEGTPNESQYLIRLGKCLLLLNDIPAAQIALGQPVDVTAEEGRKYIGSCDLCKDELTDDIGKFTCLVCCDVLLCRECMHEYNDGSDPSIKTMLFGSCLGHEFLEIQTSSLQFLDQTIGVDSQGRREWLEQLIAAYGPEHF